MTRHVTCASSLLSNYYNFVVLAALCWNLKIGCIQIEGYGLWGCNAVEIGESLTFRMIKYLPSSQSKMMSSRVQLVASRRRRIPSKRRTAPKAVLLTARAAVGRRARRAVSGRTQGLRAVIPGHLLVLCCACSVDSSALWARRTLHASPRHYSVQWKVIV